MTLLEMFVNILPRHREKFAKVEILDFPLVTKQASGREGRMDVCPAGLSAFRRLLVRKRRQ